MIKIINLSKEYKGFYALKDINLTLPSKGLIGISGESGSGKTIFYVNEYKKEISYHSISLKMINLLAL